MSRVAALVLAAGLSRRAGEANKLLARDAAGRTMVENVVTAVRHSTVCATYVVLGHEAEQISAVLTGQDVHLVTAPDYATGLAASLRAGIAALPDDVTAAIICLGDMPLVTASVLDALIVAHKDGGGRPIAVPVHDGRRGNPVLWDRRFFADLVALEGDEGARSLLSRYGSDVVTVEVADDAVLVDFDTKDDVAAFRRRTAERQ